MTSQYYNGRQGGKLMTDGTIDDTVKELEKHITEKPRSQEYLAGFMKGVYKRDDLNDTQKEYISQVVFAQCFRTVYFELKGEDYGN